MAIQAMISNKFDRPSRLDVRYGVIHLCDLSVNTQPRQRIKTRKGNVVPVQTSLLAGSGVSRYQLPQHTRSRNLLAVKRWRTTARYLRDEETTCSVVPNANVVSIRSV